MGIDQPQPRKSNILTSNNLSNRSRPPEETIHSHRRQASEQSDYVLSAKLSQNKSDLIPKKKEPMESTKNIAPSPGPVETPVREGLSGSRLKNPDSASLSSPQALFADDFANLSRQLKKINKV